jgi:hypothetical protein
LRSGLFEKPFADSWHARSFTLPGAGQPCPSDSACQGTRRA